MSIERDRALVREALRMARSEGEGEPGSPGWVHEVIATVGRTHPATPDTWRPFPVLRGRKTTPGTPQNVPWWWIERFERRIKSNHDQTLERLAERGGLDASEIWCAYHDKPLREAAEHLVDEWLMVVVPTPPTNDLIAMTAERDAAIEHADGRSCMVCDRLRAEAAGIARAVRAYLAAEERFARTDDVGDDIEHAADAAEDAKRELLLAIERDAPAEPDLAAQHQRIGREAAERAVLNFLAVSDGECVPLPSAPVAVAINAAIENARAAERERCARVCESIAASEDGLAHDSDTHGSRMKGHVHTREMMRYAAACLRALGPSDTKNKP